MSSADLPPDPLALAEHHFRQMLGECRQLYASVAAEAWQQSPRFCGASPEAWLTKMDSLHFGLVIKVFFYIIEADRVWTADKQRLSQALIEHVWKVRLEGEKLREAVLQIGRDALGLSWYSLVSPFDRIPCLREHVPELETIVMRLGNLVAKSDGKVTPSEAARLVSLQAELHRHLKPLRLDAGPNDECGDETLEVLGDAVSGEAVQEILDKPTVPHTKSPTQLSSKQVKAATVAAEPTLPETLAELDALIGLDRIKQEVRTLANFLAVQKQRAEAGLPQTTVSLHMVFGGNPGTGKTTVARIVARIYAAMGVLAKGHLVETDRSGLVARYAGQTAPLTQKKIDSALDGLLFIDEAYSLVSEEGDDAFGHEALQVLVKRLEDDRHRLVVILAGYSEPMAQLIRTNAGLSSRFSTRLTFDDYTPGQLGRIFQQMCEKNHYRAPAATQARLLAGYQWLYRQRDEHFGNGRLARNVFERAIRRLANRIAGIAPLTKELLTILEPEDIELEGVPAAALSAESLEKLRFELICPGCQAPRRLSARYLARRVQCKKCSHSFAADWPEPCDPPSPT